MEGKEKENDYFTFDFCSRVALAATGKDILAG